MLVSVLVLWKSTSVWKKMCLNCISKEACPLSSTGPPASPSLREYSPRARAGCSRLFSHSSNLKCSFPALTSPARRDETSRAEPSREHERQRAVLGVKCSEEKRVFVPCFCAVLRNNAVWWSAHLQVSRFQWSSAGHDTFLRPLPSKMCVCPLVFRSLRRLLEKGNNKYVSFLSWWCWTCTENVNATRGNLICPPAVFEENCPRCTETWLSAINAAENRPDDTFRDHIFISALFRHTEVRYMTPYSTSVFYVILCFSKKMRIWQFFFFFFYQIVYLKWWR